MSCPKCGCRMVTKVGRTTTMLICSDCGHPRDRTEPVVHRAIQRRLATAIFLSALVGTAFAIAHFNDLASPPQESGLSRKGLGE